MPRKFIAAMVGSLLLLLASAFPVSAGPILSLSGIVGDANWHPADPAIAGPGLLEIRSDLSSAFQYHGGPGGLVTIDYTGPAFFGQLSKEIASFYQITATCTNLSGCYTCSDSVCSLPGFSTMVYQNTVQLSCCIPYPIDSSYYIQELVTPSFAPYGASFTGTRQGTIGFIFDAFISVADAGQPFSLAVDPVANSAIPEPPAWTLLLAGLFGIGFAGCRRAAARK